MKDAGYVLHGATEFDYQRKKRGSGSRGTQTAFSMGQLGSITSAAGMDQQQLLDAATTTNVYGTQRRPLESDSHETGAKIDNMIATGHERLRTETSAAGSKALEVSFKEVSFKEVSWQRGGICAAELSNAPEDRAHGSCLPLARSLVRAQASALLRQLHFLRQTGAQGSRLQRWQGGGKATKGPPGFAGR